MWTDPIVEELHRIREEHASAFDNDMAKIVAEYQRLEREDTGQPPPEGASALPTGQHHHLHAHSSANSEP